MSSYILLTDLDKYSGNWTDFIETIEDCSTFIWHFPHSPVWFIRSSLSTNEITDTVGEVLDIEDDSFMIVEVTNNKQGWLTDDQWDILDNNIFI